MDDVPLLSITCTEQLQTTKKFKILAGFVVFEIFLVVLFTILCFVYPNVHQNKSDYFTLAYCHIGFWGFAVVLEKVLRVNHKRLKYFGYFVVHQKTRKFNKTLVLVLSAGNLLLLTLSTVYQHFCSVTPCSHFTVFGFALNPANYLQIIVVLELLVAIPLLSLYLAVIIKLIQSHALPDILEEERLYLHPSRRETNLIGRSSDTEPVQETLERQANFIKCLRERNLFLSSEVQRLMQARS